MVFVGLFVAAWIGIAAWLDLKEPRPELDRRKPGKVLTEQDTFVERRKDDDVGGEGG